MGEAPQAPRRLVLRGGVVGRGGALAVEDGLVAAVGDDSDIDRWVGTGHGAPEVVELDGALVLPAFVDSHVHTVRTGFALTGLDLTGSTSLERCLDALAAQALAEPDRAVLLGQGWDETDWRAARPPTAAELERAAPGRRVCLTRVDAHSSVVSPALAALVPGLADLDGWTTDGRVEREAHHAVRTTLETLIGDDERLGAARAACREMAAQGVVSFHENAAPHIGPESELPLVRAAAAEAGLHAVLYWGQLAPDEHEARATARRLKVSGLAGDLVADGAFGSRTAALSTPYADAPETCGHGYVTAEQARDHVVACTRAGVQAGFHVIGDTALEEVATGFELANGAVGVEAVAAAGHRLEHVEMPSARVVEIVGRCRVVASVQPMFDRLWGGPGRMYADRLGERWEATNPFRSLLRGGVELSFGSDSPVTSLGPWAAVRAAVHHHHLEQSLTPTEAFTAHTSGGWRAARDGRGHGLQVGDIADLALWRTPAGLDPQGLPVLDLDGPLPELVRLLAAGRTIHEGDA